MVQRLKQTIAELTQEENEEEEEKGKMNGSERRGRSLREKQWRGHGGGGGLEGGFSTCFRSAPYWTPESLRCLFQV